MITSIKVKNLGCFRDEYCGFETIKRLNLVIGRNNSGKTRLIDFVMNLVQRKLLEQPGKISCTIQLTEELLKRGFSDTTSGGVLIGNHWNDNGAKLIGKLVEFEVEESIIEISKDVFLGEAQGDRVLDETRNIERKKIVQRLLRDANGPFAGKIFRRLNSERHIQPEAALKQMELRPDGVGATNILRRYLIGSDLNENEININLVAQLQKIFAVDADFKRLAIRELEISNEGGLPLWEVYIDENNKGLVPLGKSGSGLQTVILVLLNLLIEPLLANRPVSDFVFAFEELENNLHPSLQRRLFQYVGDYASRHECTVFLTTHSSVAIDALGCRDDSQVIHLTHDGVNANSRTVSGHFDNLSILKDLGVRASDLLQANGVIWVEGPSDRVYLNKLIELFSQGTLIEGTHYQIALYAGALLSHIEFVVPEASMKKLTNLLRVNTNVAVICDSDIAPTDVEEPRISRTQLKDWVERVKNEVAAVPNAFVWVTQPKEIENYVPGPVWAAVYNKKGCPDPGRSDHFPSTPKGERDFVFRELGRKSFDKYEFATKAVKYFELDKMKLRFDLNSKMQKLIETIDNWNS